MTNCPAGEDMPLSTSILPGNGFTSSAQFVATDHPTLDLVERVGGGPAAHCAGRSIQATLPPNLSRNSRFRTLPIAERGNASVNS